MPNVYVSHLAQRRHHAALLASAFDAHDPATKALLIEQNPSLVVGHDTDRLLLDLESVGAIAAIEEVILAGVLVPDECSAWRSARRNMVS